MCHSGSMAEYLVTFSKQPAGTVRETKPSPQKFSYRFGLPPLVGAYVGLAQIHYISALYRRTLKPEWFAGEMADPLSGQILLVKGSPAGIARHF